MNQTIDQGWRVIEIKDPGPAGQQADEQPDQVGQALAPQLVEAPGCFVEAFAGGPVSLREAFDPDK